MAGLVDKLSSLNPFSSSTPKSGSKRLRDDEDAGEPIDANSAAGGHAVHPGHVIPKSQLRVSNAMKAFLAREDIGVFPTTGDPTEIKHDVIQAQLDLPHFQLPHQLTDRSHPLPSYFISSSHNTYLLAHQLYGESCAGAYETALRAGFRCVEIDAWDGDDDVNEPKVTHGYTLVSNVSFRSVCEAIRNVVDEEAEREKGDGNIQEEGKEKPFQAAPVFISLENHCGDEGQRALVRIMNEVWGDRLLSKEVREKERAAEQHGAAGSHITLAELGHKIVVIVEYHYPGEPDDSDTDSSSDEDDEDEKNARHEYKTKRKVEPCAIIVPELAALGIYAQSIKPPNDNWFADTAAHVASSPHHPLINVSESGLGSRLPDHALQVTSHNAQHLIRVYPKGTRIASRNLSPVPFWAVGAQICALNSQTFDKGVQLNHALFEGSDGFLLKPASLLSPPGQAAPIDSSSPTATSGKRTLKLHIAGASTVPIPIGRNSSEIKPYITCTLMTPSSPLDETSSKRKTKPYKHKTLDLHPKHDHSLALVARNPPNDDPLLDEVLEWEYDASEHEMAFLRILVKDDVRFATNPVLCVACVRLGTVVSGEWRFVRMLDLKGGETGCTVLLKFGFEGGLGGGVRGQVAPEAGVPGAGREGYGME